jgi:hypothetical protein
MFENRVLRIILDQRETKYQKDGKKENGSTRGLIVYTLHEVQDVYNTRSITNVHISKANLDVAANETPFVGNKYQVSRKAAASGSRLTIYIYIYTYTHTHFTSVKLSTQWPCGLRRGSWLVGCWDRGFESR